MKGLQSLDSWKDSSSYSPRTSAQSYLSTGISAKTGGSCGSSCGAGDKPKK